MKPVVFIVGPTASGKSRAAMDLAKVLDGEIISADSMQIYKGMDIGTAKPPKADLKKIRHHLIDILPASHSFSMYKFYKASLAAIRSAQKRGKTPIVAGGTGLYVRSLLRGFTIGPGAHPAFRKKLQTIAQERGTEFLHRELQKKDPARAAQLNPNDLKRLVRALEICEFSGKDAGPQKELKSLVSLGMDVRLFGIERDREALYKAINERVDEMFRAGWIAEARKLARKRISKTSSQALGYREIWEALKKNTDPEETREIIKRRTRQFAKRQLTWFRGEQGIVWISCTADSDPKNAAKKILKLLKDLP